MNYIVSPLESIYEPRGHRVQGILEFGNNNKNFTLITSNFDHSSKSKINTSNIIAGNHPFKTIVLKSIGYKGNLSLSRVLNQLIFSLKLFIFGIFNFKKNDQIIIMGSYPELSYTLALLKNIKHFDFIIDLWDIWPDAFPVNEKPFLGKFFRLYCIHLNKNSLKFAKNIFYVAPSFKEWALNYSVQAEKLVYIPLGYDHKRWPKKIESDDSKKYDFCYIGYLSYQFDLSEVIKSCIKLNKSLVIIGDGPKFFQYKQLIKFSSNIKMTGHISKSDATKILNISAIGVLPIATGGHAEMPNKLFDYIGAGLPILVTGGIDAGKFVVENGIGWYCKNNSIDILETMNSCNNLRNDFTLNLLSLREKFSIKNLYKTMGKYL